MFAAIADVLALIMYPIYDLTGNWWVTILLFTLVTKVILMPMSLWVQWNSIVMVRLMPALNRIKARYFGDQETIGEKQNELYKEKHYHPMLSLVPLAIQILILFGLVDVIHMITDSGAPGTEFLGLVPIEDGGASWAMVLLAGLSAVALGFAQNHINPLQREQTRAEKNTTNGISIGLSIFLGVFVAAGMCFYWICSNLTAILVQVLCNVIIKPRKHIDYDELAASRTALDELNKLEGNKSPWYKRDPLTKREKADYKRFFSVDGKHIVFYSEGSGFYKYFKGAIEYVLAHSDAHIHYVTNDPNDQIFNIAQENPRIHPYYLGLQRTITLMMKMDADIVVSTTEDLDTYYLKKSYVRKDIEYVFTFHHMTSTHMTATKTSYDNFDTILCVGPHQVRELRRAEELYGTKRKKLIECGYHLLDEDIASYEALVKRRASAGILGNEKPVVLVGPSWQDGNICDLCFDELYRVLKGHGWKVIVRPHPEYVKRFRPRWEAILARYANEPEDELYFEKDFSSNETVYTSDILITDWSTIFCEFSFSTFKPTIFIDTPMKIGNPDYEELGIEATDITLRNEVGVSFAPDNLEGIADTIEEMLEHRDAWRDRIEDVRAKTIFNIGHGAQIAGEYLIEAMIAHQVEQGTASEDQ